MNYKEKILYIYNNVKNNIIDHDLIKSYILDNDINYSKNSNGIFINLSILDKNFIDDIFFIISHNINNKIYNDREKLLTKYNNCNNITNDIKNNNKNDNKNNKETIVLKKIKNLSEIQLDIIELSKTI